MNALAAYLLFGLLAAPLWWPALRILLAELRAAAVPEQLAPPTLTPPPLAALRGTWSTPRSRLALQVAERRSSRRWEGGFGRRSP